MRNAIRTDYDFPKGDIRQLRPVLRYLKPYKTSVIIVCLALIVTSSAVLGMGQGLRIMVDKGFSAGNEALLDQALLALLGIIIILAIATYVRFCLITRLGELVVADIRRDIYQHLIHLSPSYFEQTKVAEIMSRLTTDTTVLQIVIGSSLSIAARNLLLLCGGLTLLIMTSPKLAGYIAIIIPLIVLPVLVLGKKVRMLSRIAQQKIADISSHIEESLAGIKIVQAYNRQTIEYDHFMDKVNDALLASLKRVKVRALLTALVIFVAFGSIGIILWIGGKDVIAGNLTAGDLSSFVFYSVIVAGAFGAISEVLGDLQKAAGATEELVGLLTARSDIYDPVKPISLPEEKAQLAFNHVSFAYASRPDTLVLNDISFAVKSGETVALVGPSGSGKSTILQLLLRYYDPTHGDIQLNNTPIHQVRLFDLREQFAYVSQDPVIFSTTAYDNIAYGLPDTTEKHVIEAAKAAQAHDFITAMPEGYQTYLGEKGVRLSGGERQRIAIARAVLRDPDILLLDEATSALDASNEQLVQKALDTLMENRTTLIIAHRLSTVIAADKIIVIDQGNIEAIGTHKQLLRRSPLYKQLAKLQFAD